MKDEVCPECNAGIILFKEEYAECNICGASFPYLRKEPLGGNWE